MRVQRYASWVRALRQTAQDLELPLVRNRRNPPLKAHWNQAGVSDEGRGMEGSRAVWKFVKKLQTWSHQQPQCGMQLHGIQSERMPSRYSTARVYRSFLNNHILPQWGDTLIQDVQPRPVEFGSVQLPLSPKSQVARSEPAPQSC